jgi:hypothetical protein
MLGGESCVKVTLENEGSDEGYAGITPNFPAKIIPIQVRIPIISMSLCVVYFPGRDV